MTEEGRVLLHILGALTVCILGGWLAKRSATRGAIVGLVAAPILIGIGIIIRLASTWLFGAFDAGILEPLGMGLPANVIVALGGFVAFETVSLVFLFYILSVREVRTATAEPPRIALGELKRFRRRFSLAGC